MNRLSPLIAALRAFARDEDAAATVDFVIGVAGGVGLAIALTQAVGDGVMALSDQIAGAMVEQGIMDYSDDGS